MSDNNDNFARLEKLLGFNPSAHPSATADVLKEVMAEEAEANRLKAKAQAKETLQKAFAIHSECRKAKSQFDSLYNKHNKELGKLVNSLERMMNGQAPTPPEGEGQPE